MWNFGGKKSPKRVRSTLVIAFSFLFLGITAFVHYAGLTEADFLSATLYWEGTFPIFSFSSNSPYQRKSHPPLLKKSDTVPLSTSFY
jgi:hypothetical protein